VSGYCCSGTTVKPVELSRVFSADPDVDYLHSNEFKWVFSLLILNQTHYRYGIAEFIGRIDTHQNHGHFVDKCSLW